MEKKRVYEYAKEHKVSSKTVLDKAKQLGIDYHSHMSTMEDGDIKKLNQSISSTAGNQVAKPSAPQSNATQKKQPAENKKAPATRTHKTTDKSELRKNTDMKNKPSNPSSNQNNGSENKGQSRTTADKNAKRPAQATSQAGQNRPNTKMNRVDSVSPNKSNDKPVQKTANTNTTTNAPAKSNRPSYGQNSGGSNPRSQGNQGRGNNPYNKNKRSKFKKGTTKQGPAVPPRKFRELPETFVYTDGMNVMEVAKKLHREPAEIIKKLFLMGIMVTQNQALGKDALELLAADYGIEAEEKIVQDISDLDSYFEIEENPEDLVSRPPVVTIMGHVDHGKTTLLDSLRNTNVIQTEAGGITQHIGAYQVKIDGKPITFLDTPGHAAFTTMRARGADVTDITIIVVAADDGVMPQTIEAINHAKAADVPIIVAVNKIDKPTANPDRVMQELSDQGLVPEAWGGETIFVNISAKFGQGIDELLEMILLVAEVQELKANPNRLAIGSVIEARLDKSKGPIATVLVQSGTLKIGDPIVVGNTHGRVRVMTNDQGRRVKTAGPAMPVEITGLNAAPQAGDHFVVFEDEKTARQAGEERAKRALMEQRSTQNRVTLDNLFSSLKDGELKEVNVIIKADVQGSVEALAASLQKIEVEGVRVKIVHSAAGAINESDVTLAAASNAIMIGFNVRPTPQAKIQAESENVDIRLHRIIYNAIDEIETAMKGMLDPEFEEQVTGQALIRETYKVSKVGTIGGAFVTDGYIGRNSSIRIIRDNIVIFDGKLASLKRFKDDAKEVKKGFECGVMIEDYNDIRIDDVIEAYHMVEIKK